MFFLDLSFNLIKNVLLSAEDSVFMTRVSEAICHTRKGPRIADQAVQELVFAHFAQLTATVFSRLFIIHIKIPSSLAQVKPLDMLYLIIIIITNHVIIHEKKNADDFFTSSSSSRSPSSHTHTPNKWCKQKRHLSARASEKIKIDFQSLLTLDVLFNRAHNREVTRRWWITKQELCSIDRRVYDIEAKLHSMRRPCTERESSSDTKMNYRWHTKKIESYLGKWDWQRHRRASDEKARARSLRLEGYWTATATAIGYAMHVNTYFFFVWWVGAITTHHTRYVLLTVPHAMQVIRFLVPSIANELKRENALKEKILQSVVVLYGKIYKQIVKFLHTTKL
jgi:hypothetical protein